MQTDRTSPPHPHEPADHALPPRLARLVAGRAGIAVALSLILAALGAWAWFRLPIDAFPDVTNTQVMIITQAPGLSSADVEERVSFPIESRMGGLPDVKQVRSISKGGLSQVVVIFEDEADLFFCRQLVFERLQEAREGLPEGVEPEMAPITTGLGEVFQYTLESDRHDATELRTIQDWIVAPRLRPLRGVTEVNSFGGFAKEYQVLVRPADLIKYGVSLDEVVEAVERNNANASGKFLDRGWEQFYVRSVGLAKTAGDLGSIVVAARGGVPIHLDDLADVVIGHMTRQGAVSRDGKGECVAGMVMMLRGANSKDVVESVKEALPHVRATLPEGARINVFYDRTGLIEACIATVVNATLEGGVCVILVLFLFLAELRTALLVVLSLPVTFLASFFIMGRLGVTSNLMTLGGIAFSVGMVVDATVVVVENARRFLAEHGYTRRDAVAAALAEVARPVAGSVAIIALVLVPLFTLEGLEGKMFIPLALTMLIAILVSLGVALLLVPGWCRLALPQGPEHEFRFIRAFHAGYVALLRRMLVWRKLTLAAALAVFAVGVALLPFLGTEFMPLLDEGAVAINAVRLPNASLAGAVAVATEIEERLRAAIPEVAAVVSKTGRAEISEDPMGPEQTDIIITFKPRGEWRPGTSRESLLEAIRVTVEKVPGLRYSFSQPIALRVNELISGIKSDVAVKVIGDDLDTLAGIAEKVAGVVGNTPGAEDAKAAQLSRMRQLDIEIDRAAAARYGINVADVNELVETAIGGKVVSTMIEGQRRFGIAVRFPESVRNDETALAKLLVHGHGGISVPLGQVATFRWVETPIEIGRENGRRRLVVECNVRGRDLGSFVADLKRRLEPLEKTLPTGYGLELGGQFENQQRAMRRLSLVVPIDLLLIFALLVFSLGTVRDALLVVANLPFALVGGVAAIVLAKMTASVSALVAFVVLLGIAVQNGVILVAFIRDLRGRGMSVVEAVVEGSRLRFRPLMMTALTSFIGHLPMLWATGSGADIQKPLAVVVMGGLVTSTLLTLGVLPVAFAMVEERFGRSGDGNGSA